jgi:hypothetical protein
MTIMTKCPKCKKLIIYSYSIDKGKSSISDLTEKDFCHCKGSHWDLFIKRGEQW